MTLGVHNFDFRPPIEMRFKAKVIALVNNFPTVCYMPFARKEIGVIIDF
jgi:hypothetical protein